MSYSAPAATGATTVPRRNDPCVWMSPSPGPVGGEEGGDLLVARNGAGADGGRDVDGGDAGTKQLVELGGTRLGADHVVTPSAFGPYRGANAAARCGWNDWANVGENKRAVMRRLADQVVGIATVEG